MTRDLLPPIREHTTLLVYKCSECSWFFVINSADAIETAEERLARVLKHFAQHECSKFPNL